MTKMEEKSLLTQIELYKEIASIDTMILYMVQLTAQEVLNKVVKPKMYTKSDQTTVELTVEEFAQIRVALAKLSSDEGFKEMNLHIEHQYIKPKEEKIKIIRMLQ